MTTFIKERKIIWYCDKGETNIINFIQVNLGTGESMVESS